MSEDKKAVVEFTGDGVQLSTLDEAWRFADALSRSGDMCPQHFRGKPEAILAAIQRGAEIGLNPMQSLDSIYVVQGRPTLSGATALALMNLPSVMEPGKRTKAGFHVRDDGKLEGFCWSWRRGDDTPLQTQYDEDRAKAMGLWGKKNSLWEKDPGTMLKWRAVGEHSRNFYSDVLKGLYLGEEARDFQPVERDVTPRDPQLAGPGDPLLSELRGSEGGSERAVEPEVDPETGEVIPDYIGAEDA